MRIIVLSDHPLIRQALCGLAAQEGLPATPASSLRELADTVAASDSQVVVLLDAMQSFVLADAFLGVAQGANLWVALLCCDDTRALQYHPAVRCSLVAPFPANILRSFLRNCVAPARPGVAKTTGIRSRLDLATFDGNLHRQRH